MESPAAVPLSNGRGVQEENNRVFSQLAAQTHVGQTFNYPNTNGWEFAELDRADSRPAFTFCPEKRHPEVTLGSLRGFEKCPDWAPTLDKRRRCARIALKTMDV